MKQFEKKYEISFRWWREDGKNVKAKDEENLEIKALRQIDEARNNGYTEGELIVVDYSKAERPIEYRGYWEFKELVFQIGE